MNPCRQNFNPALLRFSLHNKILHDYSSHKRDQRRFHLHSILISSFTLNNYHRCTSLNRVSPRWIIQLEAIKPSNFRSSQEAISVIQEVKAHQRHKPLVVLSLELHYRDPHHSHSFSNICSHSSNSNSSTHPSSTYLWQVQELGLRVRPLMLHNLKFKISFILTKTHSTLLINSHLTLMIKRGLWATKVVSEWGPLALQLRIS